MKRINILHLYPNEMNTYGDHGNVLTLAARIKWHGYDPNIIYHHPGDKLNKDVDIVVGGGGQDSAQANVQKDILAIGDDLKELAENTPMLMVCGTYQLFGHKFITSDKKEIKGIGLFNIETRAGNHRMIGNIKIKSEFGVMYGFENHSGATILGDGQEAFGHVLRGNGNNGKDKTEGARTDDVFGTYMHGPVLPNNPNFCDYLIEKAAVKKFGSFNKTSVDDWFAELARKDADSRHY